MSTKPENNFSAAKGKTPLGTTFSENERKLELVFQYLRDPKSLSRLYRTHQLNRQDIHYWIKLLRTRADMIFEHGSTVRKRARFEETNRALRQKIIDLEQTVSELRAELEELKSPSAED
jgi:transposase-like protein